MTVDVALAIVISQTTGRILIARRPREAHLGGYWEFPGGKVEAGETPRACALREALEETGLTVEIHEEWPEIVHDYPDRAIRLFPFLASADTDQAAAPSGAELRWVAVDSLRDYEFPAANEAILNALLTMPTGPQPTFPAKRRAPSSRLREEKGR